jgi:LAO/AO transport system kinase
VGRPGDTLANADDTIAGACIEGIVAGKRLAIARAMSELEAGTASGRAIQGALDQRARGAVVIGITGPPGAGKSTLVNALTRHWRRRGLTVAVVAVDPSSPLSGGAILGDRIRMTAALDDDGVFVRSLASRGHLGGISPAAVQVLDVLDVAGYERIVLETVGTGQSEVDVAEIADVPVVVAAPGLGDDIQAMKSGLLEVAALLVVNKADLPGGEQTLQQLKGAVSIRGGEQAQVAALAVSALNHDGIDELAAAIDDLLAMAAVKCGRERRIRRARYVIAQAAMATVRQALADMSGRARLDEAARALLSGDDSVAAAAHAFLSAIGNQR